jgi:hypothetical protein
VSERLASGDWVLLAYLFAAAGVFVFSIGVARAARFWRKEYERLLAYHQRYEADQLDWEGRVALRHHDQVDRILRLRQEEAALRKRLSGATDRVDS